VAAYTAGLAADPVTARQGQAVKQVDNPSPGKHSPCEVCGLADHRPLVAVHAECADKLVPF
jgi:hypothetical protein